MREAVAYKTKSGLWDLPLGRADHMGGPEVGYPRCETAG